MLDRTVSVGDLLTALAIVVSAAGVLYELHKDRSLRRKEIADRVRRSAGRLIAKIHRWQSISQSLYTGVHTLVTEADEMLVNDKNAVTSSTRPLPTSKRRTSVSSFACCRRRRRRSCLLKMIVRRPPAPSSATLFAGRSPRAPPTL